MNEAHPSDRELRDLHEAATRGAEEAQRRSETAAMRRTELAQALAGREHGNHEAAERAKRAADEALVRSAEAHESSAAAHEAAAQLYERAAQLAERHGDGNTAARYREKAASAREDAQLSVRLAQEDRVRRLSDG
ncbi:MAG: hypothetical protein ACTHMY_09685 [Solirubrobacteraceae bacterium]